MITREIIDRQRQEVADAVAPLRMAVKASAVIGGLAFIWTIIAMIWGTTQVDEGMVFLAGTALGTIVPAAGLIAAIYRTSLGAARLERALEDS